MALGQLLYTSDAAEAFMRQDLQDIHAQSLRNNTLLGITGILFYCDGHFVQLLEGDPAILRDLFRKIVQDDRHEHIKLLIEQPATRRVFDNWDMALLDLDAYPINARRDLEDLVYMAGYQSKDPDETPAAMQILNSFRELLQAV